LAGNAHPLFGTPYEQVLKIDPENVRALIASANDACHRGDVPAEIGYLARLVQLNAWRAKPAARLAYLTRDRPAGDRAHAIALAAQPYLPTAAPRTLSTCMGP